jgi:hypothetical protein
LHGDFGRSAQDPDLNVVGLRKIDESSQRRPHRDGMPWSWSSNDSEASSTATLTPEQRTRIRETVLVGRNAPRVSSVNFKIAVGSAVPSTVHVVEVPEFVVEIHPELKQRGGLQ